MATPSWLEKIANLLAYIGGVIMTGIAVMSVYSVVMRNLLGKPIQGDFELVQVGCAVGIALFLPVCQLRNGHIMVDFFTSKVSDTTRDKLDAFGLLLLGIALAVFAWRTGVGGMVAKSNSETTMMMGLPTWYAYVGMVPGLAVAAMIAFQQAFQKFASAGKSSVGSTA